MKNIPDLPDTISIFPLAGALLLPRARLPLHLLQGSGVRGGRDSHRRGLRCCRRGRGRPRHALLLHLGERLGLLRGLRGRWSLFRLLGGTSTSPGTDGEF